SSDLIGTRVDGSKEGMCASICSGGPSGRRLGPVPDWSGSARGAFGSKGSPGSQALSSSSSSKGTVRLICAGCLAGRLLGPGWGGSACGAFGSKGSPGLLVRWAVKCD
ncbi:hypothetical protein THAOC_37033, partial [Thalassiosira oceanica]